jgi:hypothetical protein
MANELNETIERLHRRIEELEKREADRQAARRKVASVIGAVRSGRTPILVGAALVACLSTAVYLYAATITAPAAFTSGTAITAAAVNGNFTTLYTNESSINTQLNGIVSSPWAAAAGGISYTGGLVGIGMAPNAGNSLAVNGNLWIVGSIIDSSGVVTSSDRRLKKDVATLPGALDALGKLRGVTYRWIDPKKGAQLQYGVIAQEVEAVYPDLVSTDPNGMKGVNYNGFVAPFIESIKELKAENDGLKHQNADLEKRLAAIERKLGM